MEKTEERRSQHGQKKLRSTSEKPEKYVSLLVHGRSAVSIGTAESCVNGSGSNAVMDADVVTVYSFSIRVDQNLLLSRSAHTNNQYESRIFTTNFLFIYFLSTFTR